MMFTKSYVRVLFLFIIAIFVLMLPNLLRSYNTYIGEDSYFYSRISDSINNYDKLSYSGRDFSYSQGQTIIFSFFKNIFPIPFVINIIPIILGIISLILFYLILKELYVEPNVIYFSLILLILSPPFIYIFSSYNSFTLTTFILFLMFYLFINKNEMSNLLSYLLIFIIPFFGYEFSVLALALILIYCIKQKEIKRFYISLLVSIISLSLAYLPLLSQHGFSESLTIGKSSVYKSLFSDLGSNFGISIFIIFLGFFGLSYLWFYKYKYYHVYLCLIILLIFTFYFDKFIIYLNFLLVFLSGSGLINLIRSKWESETIRKLTLWLLIIGILFSTATFVNETSKQDPSKNLYEALNFLKNYDNKESVVFSHYSYGIYINSIADKKNIMDSKFLYAPNLNERYKDSEKLFYTRDYDVASDIIKKYNIEYILITEKMKDGLVWEEDEGLLFLLNSIKSYKLIYRNNEVEIWRIEK